MADECAMIGDAYLLARRAEPSVAAGDEHLNASALLEAAMKDAYDWIGECILSTGREPEKAESDARIVKYIVDRVALASPAVSQKDAPEAPALTQDEIYTLRRLIECAEALDKRPRPLCRDCADEDGTCPNGDKLECDMGKLFADAKRLHNKLAAPAAQQAVSQMDGEAKLDLTDYNRAVNYANGTSTTVISPAATTASASEQAVVNDAFLKGAHAEFSEAMPPGSLTSLGHRYVVNALRAAIKFYIQVDACRIDTPIRLLREVLKQHDDHAELIRAEGDYPVPNPTAERIRAVLAQQGASRAANAGEDTSFKVPANFLLVGPGEIRGDFDSFSKKANRAAERLATIIDDDLDRAAISSSAAQEAK
jgi:hypothetical protein